MPRRICRNLCAFVLLVSAFADQSEAFGDKGLAVQLEDMVRDESGHAEETERERHAAPEPPGREPLGVLRKRPQLAGWRRCSSRHCWKNWRIVP